MDKNRAKTAKISESESYSELKSPKKNEKVRENVKKDEEWDKFCESERKIFTFRTAKL